MTAYSCECGKCSVCRTRTYRHKHPEKALEWGRRQRAKPESKAKRRAYDLANRERINEYKRIYNRKKREQGRAYGRVAHALKTGRLTKEPCEVCGEQNVHAHHDDYNRPLDVRWLCPKHHAELHRKTDIRQETAA